MQDEGDHAADRAVVPKARALVTGASSGIGQAIAVGLAAWGARVALLGRRAEALSRVVDRCGSGASCHPCDLTDERAVDEMVSDIQTELGGLDILVHSSGIMHTGRMDESAVSDLDQQYTANVRAPYRLTKLVMPMLRASKGQIVFINSSIVRAANIAGRGQYASMQRALRALADSIRDEVNGYGVRVTTVYPGSTATPRQERLHAAAGRDYIPETLLQPEDVARSVLSALTMARTAEITDIFLRAMAKPRNQTADLARDLRQAGEP